jgi:hypothetical protein
MRLNFILTAGFFVLFTSTSAFAEGPPPLAPMASTPQELPPPPPPRHRNEGMRIAGIVLTSVAAAALATGATVVGVEFGTGGHRDVDGSLEGPLVAGLVGVPIALGSAVLASVGIPLWVAGSRPPASTTAGATWTPPTVAVGPTGGALRWSF